MLPQTHQVWFWLVFESFLVSNFSFLNYFFSWPLADKKYLYLFRKKALLKFLSFSFQIKKMSANCYPTSFTSSKSTMEIPEQCVKRHQNEFCCCSRVFIVYFKHIFTFSLVFLLFNFEHVNVSWVYFWKHIRCAFCW